MSVSAQAALATLAALATGVSGCAMDAPPPDSIRDPFIALTSDFDGFTTWPRVEIPDIGTTTGHAPGMPRFVYVRLDVPDVWEDPFPVGSILVKTLEAGAPSTWEVHAMVKRGGDFSPDAGGWEWFDLALDDARAPSIAWRGEGSPRDPGGYVLPDGSGVVPCTECHGVVAGSDYVFTRATLADALAP